MTDEAVGLKGDDLERGWAARLENALIRNRFEHRKSWHAHAQAGNKGAAERARYLWRSLSLKRAMRLASCSTYLPPWEVLRVGAHLCRRYSNTNMTMTALEKELWFKAGLHVGLVKGNPPMQIGEPGFGSLARALLDMNPHLKSQARKKAGPLAVDLAVLAAVTQIRKGMK